MKPIETVILRAKLLMRQTAIKSENQAIESKFKNNSNELELIERQLQDLEPIM